jgi:RNA polymerase sigma-70 factor (ECF subfamily)
MSSDFRTELVEHLRPLRAFARSFHANPARADDLVQEAVTRALANRDKYQSGTNMRAWLFTILRNVYYSEMRKRKREVEDPDDTLASLLVQPETQSGHMSMRDFRIALAQINPDQREALVLVGASGFSYEEAAEICGCAPGTVKSRVNRARIRLLALLGEGGEPSGEPGAEGVEVERTGPSAPAEPLP